MAKAYLRAPLVNINSGTIGFNGHKIGLNGFKACFHDEKLNDKVNLVKNRIGKVSEFFSLLFVNNLRFFKMMINDVQLMFYQIIIFLR